MRTIVLLVLLANVGFFAYHHYLGVSEEAAAQIQLLQISPEKIISVTAETMPGSAAPSTLAGAPPPAACVEWGALGAVEAVRADAALAALGLPAGAMLRRVTELDGYWVHMAPLKSKAEIDRKIGELKALDVTEYYVVQDAGPWRNAVSLGLYKSEAAANTEMERLRERGVRSAIVTRRDKFLKQVNYFVREPSAATIARLTDLQRGFPATEIRAVSCPVGTPGKQ